MKSLLVYYRKPNDQPIEIHVKSRFPTLDQGCDFRGSKASELGIWNLGSTEKPHQNFENF